MNGKLTGAVIGILAEWGGKSGKSFVVSELRKAGWRLPTSFIQYDMDKVVADAGIDVTVHYAGGARRQTFYEVRAA